MTAPLTTRRSVPGFRATTATPARTCSCVTRTWDDERPLLDLLPQPVGALSFVSSDSGLVGWGQHAVIRTAGADAADQIERWYDEQLAALEVTDEAQVTGSGPVCFVSLGFAPTDESVAVIPEVVVGARDGVRFVSRIGDGGPDGNRGPDHDASTRYDVTAPGEVRYSDAELSAAGFMTAVETAVTRIRSGEAAKVVLAHGLTGMTEFSVDERFLLAGLAERYSGCATFAVDGLVGASPEMLIRRYGSEVSSRVLAGTAWPGGRHDPTAGGEATQIHGIATHLLTSAKDLSEHTFAVDSVAEVLRPLTTALDVPSRPSVLELATLAHLATDVSGRLAETARPSALELAARLHPTAAVGGMPTDIARAMIAELEPAPRGRYAAPVGWVDSHGDGEFAIALRCATVSGRRIEMMAGCGIVADSDPVTEAREAQVKMTPVRDALEG